MSCVRCIVRTLKNVYSLPPTAVRMLLLSNGQNPTPDRDETTVKASNKALSPISRLRLPSPTNKVLPPSLMPKGVSLNVMTTNVRHVVKNLRATP